MDRPLIYFILFIVAAIYIRDTFWGGKNSAVPRQGHPDSQGPSRVPVSQDQPRNQAQFHPKRSLDDTPVTEEESEFEGVDQLPTQDGADGPDDSPDPSQSITQPTAMSSRPPTSTSAGESSAKTHAGRELPPSVVVRYCMS
mmetsp:Transcript_1440/g.1981  ORF Transcript_1440/g.1981 Transcript_1440/m.1981 type:complete len:141 (-) Transcript_1440:841-1263(-)|eukprot:CAMPEP_0113943736 /NCGR_PEP_ID=MMETSP1339-20121228/27170_1 /TAXON_ID=94617 /ORGANISM="Fibrocapsa japonica" /LENGTH=140 /DNA_ID=CAMNT_0000948681 /DNA_START=85 /DNA_END=507 /DNA_ORIENTATION=- /assembly_acc=CAM_ASM_000762